MHAEFVSKAKPIFHADNIDVHPDYYLFDENEKKYDVVFCLNVVHHLGDDFLNTGDMELAKRKMISCINQLASTTDCLVFQMGYNWCGNRNRCLFENGTKKEMEKFVADYTENCWSIVDIGIAEKIGDNVVYKKLNVENNVRNNQLGEFLNRPLFIMKSKIV